jgi:hypothetical protein
MNRIAWLGQRIATAKDLQKRWKARESEWKKELDGLLNEEVGYIPPGEHASDQSVTVDAGEYKVSRTVYHLTPSIDIDLLWENAPEIARRVVRQRSENYVDEGLLEEVISESPESFELIKAAMVDGDQRVRFDVKRKKQ